MGTALSEGVVRLLPLTPFGDTVPPPSDRRSTRETPPLGRPHACVATAARRCDRSDMPAPPPPRLWLCPQLRQHSAHERQQLVQGVEPGHLVGDHMLDAAAPRRRPTGPRAKLDHKGLIARERRLGWGHAYLPYADVRVYGFLPCLCLEERIESPARSGIGPARFSEGFPQDCE